MQDELPVSNLWDGLLHTPRLVDLCMRHEVKCRGVVIVTRLCCMA